MCTQWRHRSAWASAQSDQSYCCPHEEAWVLSFPLSAQWRLWSDWADAQADLSLHWAHKSLCWFCYVVAQLYSFTAFHLRNSFFLTFIEVLTQWIPERDGDRCGQMRASCVTAVATQVQISLGLLDRKKFCLLMARGLRFGSAKIKRSNLEACLEAYLEAYLEACLEAYLLNQTNVLGFLETLVLLKCKLITTNLYCNVPKCLDR